MRLNEFERALGYVVTENWELGVDGAPIEHHFAATYGEACKFAKEFSVCLPVELIIRRDSSKNRGETSVARFVNGEQLFPSKTD